MWILLLYFTSIATLPRVYRNYSYCQWHMFVKQQISLTLEVHSRTFRVKRSITYCCPPRNCAFNSRVSHLKMPVSLRSPWIRGIIRTGWKTSIHKKIKNNPITSWGWFLFCKGLTLVNLLKANQWRPYLSTKHMKSETCWMGHFYRELVQGLTPETAGDLCLQKQIQHPRGLNKCAKSTALELGSLIYNPRNENQQFQLYNGMNNTAYFIKLLWESNNWLW